jgi:hypothetical protein
LQLNQNTLRTRNTGPVALRFHAIQPCLLGCLLLAGCSGAIQRITSASSSATLNGHVHGGQQPISGATIQLYAAGVTGDASSATPLIATTTLTDRTGSFNISGAYTCPSPSSQVYLLATGGDPGTGAINRASALMAAIGPCGSLNSSTVLMIDEATTVASIYPFAHFMTSSTNVGSSYANTAALATAFAEINQLIDMRTGVAPGPALAAGYGVPVANLNSLSNVIAACVNSNGGVAGDGSVCGTLFLDVTPAGGIAPTNTVDAILNIAKNPTQNVTGLFNLSPAGGPFQPTLAVAPPDWTVSVLPTLTPSTAGNLAAIGGSATGTLMLGHAAPAGGVTVGLASSRPDVLSVASTVTIAAGQNAASFSYTGLSSGASTVTAAAAGYLGGAVTLATTTSSISLGTLPALAPASSVPLSIRLNSPAPAGGTTLTLKSSNSAVVAITPTTVAIPAGATSPAVSPIVTGGAPGIAEVNVAGTGFAGASTTVAVALSATLPATFSASIDAPGSATLSLSAPAPAGGLTFSLSSDNGALVSVPATVTVPQGANSVSFRVTAMGVGNTVVRANALNVAEATSAVKAMYTTCSMWGDSLTQGDEDHSGVTVESALQALGFCGTVYNEGAGGNTSTQIAARAGAVPTTATITSGVIPASGPTGITFKAGYEPITNQGATTIKMTINGVAGTTTYSNHAYNFARTTPGDPVVSAANSPVAVQIGNVNSGLVIIWSGTNNYQDPVQVQADIAAMVAALPSPKHYVILSVINTDDFWVWSTGGQSPYPTLIALNNALAATYPNNYIDIRSLLVAAYDPTNPQDVIDHGHDIPPSSFRAQDFRGSITSAADASSCGFSVTPNMARYGATITIGSEKVYISGSDGTTLSSCTRGYAGTVAVAHAVGETFTGLDPIHLNGPVAGVFIADQISRWMQTH